MDAHATNMIEICKVDRAREKGIRFNPDKMKIGFKELPFFGHLVADEGLKIDGDIEA